MEGAVYIPDVMKMVVDRVNTADPIGKSVYYMFGHPLEITARLQEMSKNPSKPDKYPLIALFTDIAIVNDKLVGFYGAAKFSMVIATITKQTYTAEQRKEINFKPVLQPIKEELINQISRHAQFTNRDELIYTEIERYYWGRNGLYGNTGNIFNDFIDCIELQNISVNVLKKICTTIKSNF